MKPVIVASDWCTHVFIHGFPSALQHRVHRAVLSRHLHRRDHRSSQLPLGNNSIPSPHVSQIQGRKKSCNSSILSEFPCAVLACVDTLYWTLNCVIFHVGGQSFEEASQALELVQPTVFIFDGSYSSWALRLKESNSLTSVNLYLFLGNLCSISQAANCKFFRLLFYYCEQAGYIYMRILLPCELWLSATRIYTWKFVSVVSVVSVEQIKRSSGGTTRAVEPVSAPNDVALICFTSGKRLLFLALSWFFPHSALNYLHFGEFQSAAFYACYRQVELGSVWF